MNKLLQERSTYLLQMESMNLQPRINLESVNSDYLNYIKNLSSECKISEHKSNNNDISKESSENTSNSEDPGPSKLYVMTPNDQKFNKEEECSNLRKSDMTQEHGKLPKTSKERQKKLNAKTYEPILVNDSPIIPSVSTIALNTNLEKNNKSSLFVGSQQKCSVKDKCKYNTSINDNFNKNKCGGKLDLSNLYITTAKSDFDNLNTKTSKNIIVKEGECSNKEKKPVIKRGHGRSPKTSNREQKTFTLKTTKPIIIKDSPTIVGTVTLKSSSKQNKLPFDAPSQKCLIEGKSQPNKFINNELNENKCSNREPKLSNLFITTASSDYNNLNINADKNTMVKEGECSNARKTVIKRRGRGRQSKTSNEEQKTLNLKITKPIIVKDSSTIVNTVTLSSGSKQNNKLLFDAPPQKYFIEDKNQPNKFINNELNENEYRDEELELSNLYITTLSSDYNDLNTNVDTNTIIKEGECSNAGKPVINQGCERLQKTSKGEPKTILVEDSSKMDLVDDGKLCPEVIRHYTKSPIFYISPRNLPIVDKSQSKPSNDYKFSGNKYNNEELELSNSFVPPVSFDYDNFNKNISKNSMNKEEHSSVQKSVLQQDHHRKPPKISNEKKMIFNLKTTQQTLMEDFPIHGPIGGVKPNPSLKQTNTSSLFNVSLQKLSLEDTQQGMFNDKSIVDKYIRKDPFHKKRDSSNLNVTTARSDHVNSNKISMIEGECSNIEIPEIKLGYKSLSSQSKEKKEFFDTKITDRINQKRTFLKDFCKTKQKYFFAEHCLDHLFDECVEESNLSSTDKSTQVDNKSPSNLKSPYKSLNKESNVSDVFDARRKTQ